MPPFSSLPCRPLPLLLLSLLALAGCGDKEGVGADGEGSDTGRADHSSEGTGVGECSDGADNDGDGLYDCNDPDCEGAPDCSEANTPGGCGDGVDNDGDGRADCDDPDCASDEGCGGEGGGEGDDAAECSDGEDNDGDGEVDCDDDGCAESPDCRSDGVDEDGDGVSADEDCNDADATMPADDADCDGARTADDCDDADATMPADDADCDGVRTADDCDDADASVGATGTVVADDADCDGALTGNDCDDFDPAVGSPDADDPDCDGVPTHAGGGDLIRIAAGTFDMGCTAGQSGCQSIESPVTPVTLTHDYFIGETEVTQGQYQALMGVNPSYYSACGSTCPVDSISWHRAAAFTNAISTAAGLTECYSCSGTGSSTSCVVAVDPYSCDGYRLPTEAEWEGAARCGNDFLYAGSDSIGDVAWYYDNSGGTTHPVGVKSPNACGLYDMSGNVWEWTQDFAFFTYTSSGQTDPTGSSSGYTRVTRGGSLWGYAAQSRVSLRWYNDPGYPDNLPGFRVARTIP